MRLSGAPSPPCQRPGVEILTDDAKCTYKPRGLMFRRTCGDRAIGQCVYCGHPFCDVHGTLEADYYEVCRRERCSAKFQDLDDHKEWIKQHHHANLAGYCAADGCEEALDIPCERCGLRYCQPHVKATSVKVVEMLGDQSIRSQLLCPHCVSRRKIWD